MKPESSSCGCAGVYQRCGFNPPGQLTHILRRSFTSHYMIVGGDILGLQQIRRHAPVMMSSMSPDHLESAVRLSPLVQRGYVAS